MPSTFLCPKGWNWNCSTWFVGSGLGFVFLNLIVFKSVFPSLSLYISIDQLASMFIYRLYSLSWAFCSSLVPSGSKCVSAQSEWLNKQTLMEGKFFLDWYIVEIGKQVLTQSKSLRGYCTPGPYFWRLCAFSQKIKQLRTKYPTDLVRNVPRNSKITVLLQ